VKVVKEREFTPNEYAHTVAQSIKHLKKFVDEWNRILLLSESRLDDECKSLHGTTWTYDPELKACVDTRESLWNDCFTREQDELVVTYDPARMGLYTPPATGRDAYANTSVYKQPRDGTSLGQSGNTFRGDMRNVSQQTRVVRGRDPAADKPEGIWKTSITEPEDTYPKKKKTIKIKL